LSKHDELTINSSLKHIQTHSGNVVCASSTNCVLQLPVSSLYSRSYSRAFYGHLMDLSAMSRRHLHSLKPADQLIGHADQVA